jgi:hypothetical protein
MKIPPPPTVSRGTPLFEQVRAIARHEEMADAIRDLIKDFRRDTHLPAVQEVLTRFLAVVKPGPSVDVTRLPYPASSPNATYEHGTPLGCLYTRLSWLIQRYWSMCIHGDESPEHLQQYIDDLRAIQKAGLRNCHVTGDERTGYWLEVK